MGRCLVLLAAAALILHPPTQAAAQDKAAPNTQTRPATAGWVENGWITEPPIRVKVKLDTGAKTSSINAPRYREFEKDGKPHVAFTLTNNEGREVDIVRPVVRVATIRRAGADKQDRPVISLAICVAGVTREVEFTMADRSELNYPILVGRSFLAGKILVDAGRTFLASGLCGKP